MPLTQSGRTLIAATLIADGDPGSDVGPLNAANAYLGVGDSAGAFATQQTDLQAASNKVRKGMSAGYPSRSGNVVRFRAVFDPGEANFHWQEWGLFNNAIAGLMLNRKVRDLGTKPNTETWQLFVTVTVEIGA